MNLVTETRPGGVMVLKATAAPADYAPEVEKNLREYRRKANIPGFRAGMVPMGVINKMYRKGVVAEQAYRKANEAVFKHLEENKIDIMGDVLPSEEQVELDFSDGVTEHEFVFEVGVAPVVDITLGEGDKLTRYKIKPTDEMREGYRKGLEGPGAAEAEEEEAAEEASEGAEAKGAKKAGAKAKAAEKPADPELEKKVDEMIAADLARESDYLFSVQLKNYLLAKANLQLPEEFLKRWLFAVNEGKFTMEEIEKDFPAFLRMMAWNLVQKHFVDKLELTVTQEDMLAEAKAIARMQFAQYGMRDVPEETLEGFAKSILGSKEEAQRMFERVLEDKVVDALKPLAKVSEKSVSVEEFQKIASEMQ